MSDELEQFKRQSRNANIAAVVDEYIRENEITCGETIYQSDRISLSALELIEKLCDAAGYHEIEDDDVCP